MKIGIIFAAFQAEDLLTRSLTPWIEARSQKLGGHEFVICAVSVPFEGFDTSGEPADNTRSILGAHVAHGKDIDHAIVRDRPMKETEARGAALRWLVEQGVEVTWMVDHDEVYTTTEIQRILAFIQGRPLVAAFRGSLRNLVFDERTYLVQPFTPMRGHRVTAGGYTADSFWDDNNVLYRSRQFADHAKRDIDLPCLTIPKALQFTAHYTWLNDQRSKRKSEYQWARWKRCDFDWDDSRGGLIWRDGVAVPETARDSV